MTEEIRYPQAKGVSFESFHDLDQLQPGELFELTWAFLNEGDTTWEDVALVYTDESHPEATPYSHTNFTTHTQFQLRELGTGQTLAPGDAAYVTLQLTAPDTPGVYMTGWQLQTSSGERFGPGREVRIIVVASAAKALTALAYELVAFNNSAANYNNMQAGQPFTGNWLLKNSGLDTWSGNFKVATSAAPTANTQDAQFNQMGAPLQASLHELSGQDSVPPETTVTLQLSFTAPNTPGIYAFHWQLVDNTGQPFGGVRWMRIIVAQPNGTAPQRPSDTASYTYQGPQVTFFTGIHGPADDWMWGDQSFQTIMRRLNMPVFFWSQGANGNHADFGDKSKNAVRLFWNPRPVSADAAYEEVREDQLRPWWNRGYRRFIFFNEPQFGMEIAKIEEGMGIAWHNKEQFANFLGQVLRRAKQDFPDIQLFTTPMSSNEAFDPWGWRDHMWAQVKDVVSGWCMHAYSGDNGNADAAAQNIANQVIELQRRYQLKIPIIVSEASVNRGSDAEQKARVAHLLQNKLAQVPGVEGVFWYAADWNPDYDQHHEGWFRNGIAEAYLRQIS